MEYISLSWCDISWLVKIEVCCYNKAATEPRVPRILRGSYYCERFTDVTASDGNHHFVSRYGMCHKYLRICSTSRNHNSPSSSTMTYYWVCSNSNTTGADSGAGVTYPSRTHEFMPCFKWGSCC